MLYRTLDDESPSVLSDHLPKQGSDHCSHRLVDPLASGSAEPLTLWESVSAPQVIRG